MLTFLLAQIYFSMKPLSEFTRDEKSQLLYLETRIVDYAGKIDGRHMNAGDWEIMGRWRSVGFIDYGRICLEDAKSGNGADWCQFSGQAWEYAHKRRKLSAENRWENRTWKTTQEKREE